MYEFLNQTRGTMIDISASHSKIADSWQVGGMACYLYGMRVAMDKQALKHPTRKPSSQ